MIDEWIDPRAWPQAVQDATAQFEQGDIVEQPPFFYVATAEYGIWRLTRETGDTSLSSELFELDPRDAPPMGMITTETCDLVEEDGQPRQPWISVAPVYELANLDTNNLSLLANNRVAYMRQLTATRFSGSMWVADVRIEFPIEKSWLVGKHPVQAFQTPEERADLAVFLSRRRDRPVLAGQLHRSLLTPMRRWIECKRPQQRGQILAEVAEVRVAISGNPLDPDGASLIVLGDKEHVPEAVRQAWDAKWSDWQAKMDEADMALLPHKYATLDSLSAREYLESYRVPLEFAIH